MPEIDNIAVIAQACIDTNALIQAHGTPMMKTLMRLLLAQIAEEVASRQPEICEGLTGG